MQQVKGDRNKSGWNLFSCWKYAKIHILDSCQGRQGYNRILLEIILDVYYYQIIYSRFSRKQKIALTRVNSITKYTICELDKSLMSCFKPVR